MSCMVVLKEELRSWGSLKILGGHEHAPELLSYLFKPGQAQSVIFTHFLSLLLTSTSSSLLLQYHLY